MTASTKFTDECFKNTAYNIIKYFFQIHMEYSTKRSYAAHKIYINDFTRLKYNEVYPLMAISLHKNQ